MVAAILGTYMVQYAGVQKVNYKALLRDWIKERRNSPSVILWGLENESKLPEDFAKEWFGYYPQIWTLRHHRNAK